MEPIDMGWSIGIATERDSKRVTWLSRHFSYELLRDDGCLRAFITDQEAQFLGTGSVDEPDTWEERDAGAIGEILRWAFPVPLGPEGDGVVAGSR
jgi:hypothetical protein